MNKIVVGIDGSAGSKQALAWAADEARLRGAKLTAIAAWRLPAAFYGGGGWGGTDTDLFEELGKLAEQRLDEACKELGAALDDIEFDRAVVNGAAAEVLLEAAKDADLLVVGTRGHGGFAGLLMGSVSQQVAQHSPCPITIVPPR